MQLVIHLGGLCSKDKGEGGLEVPAVQPSAPVGVVQRNSLHQNTLALDCMG